MLLMMKRRMVIRIVLDVRLLKLRNDLRDFGGRQVIQDLAVRRSPLQHLSSLLGLVFEDRTHFRFDVVAAGDQLLHRAAIASELTGKGRTGCH